MKVNTAYSFIISMMILLNAPMAFSASPELLEAIEEGSPLSVEAVLYEGGDMGPQNDGLTVLHAAVSRGNMKIFRMILSNLRVRGQLAQLIDYRACENGQTALHWAASRGHLDMVLELFCAGASARIEDGDGYTPQECARLWSYSDPERYSRVIEALNFWHAN